MDRERPVFPGLDLTPASLARQGRALRSLARALLGDAHAAEDVVQETWLACLRRPGSVPVRVSAWLATITTNLAHKHARGEGRRRAREERAALEHGSAPDRAAFEQQTLEREEALRAVTRALLELEEPFKGALIQRYFEQRTPAEIAALSGVALATIKSRLVRGLEKLRVRLAAERGAEGRARLLLVLTGAPPVLGGVLAPLSALAAALLAAGGLLWLCARGTEPAAPRSLAQSAPSAPAARHASPEPEGEAALRAPEAERRRALAPLAAEPEEPEPAATLAPEARFAYRIAGRVRAENDLPRPGARIFLGPRGLPLNYAAETDERGRFELELVGRRPTLALVLMAERESLSTGLHELELVAGSALEVDVALWDAEVLRQRSPALQELALTFTQPEIQQIDRPEILLGSHGCSLFAAPAECGGCERPRLQPDWIRAFLTSRVQLDESFLDARSLQLRATHLQDLQVFIGLQRSLLVPGVISSEPEPVTGIHGRVRDEWGEPVPGAEVSWGTPDGAVTGSLTSDELGDFALQELEAGELWVRAGGGDHGQAHARFALRAGENLRWEPVLARGPEVSGRLVGPDGAGLVGVRIELWSASSTRLWSDATLTDDAGRFAFPNVAPGVLELHVTAPEAVLPGRVLRPVLGGTDLGVIELAAAELTTGALRVRAVDGRGNALGGAELLLWSEAAGRGILAGEPDAEGGWTLRGLPFGAYRAEILSVLGAHALGTLWVRPASAAEPIDLGLERLAPLGRLQLDLADGLAASDELERVRVSLWRASTEVFALALSWDEAVSTLALLPPGDYVLCAARPGSARAEAPFTVAAGATTGLTLDLTLGLAGDELTFRPGAGPEMAQLRASAEEREALASAACSACHADARH